LRRFLAVWCGQLHDGARGGALGRTAVLVGTKRDQRQKHGAGDGQDRGCAADATKVGLHWKRGTG